MGGGEGVVKTEQTVFQLYIIIVLFSIFSFKTGPNGDHLWERGGGLGRSYNPDVYL